MTDILKRIQSARKEAFYEFLKQKTINELSVFIRDASTFIRATVFSTSTYMLETDHFGDKDKVRSWIEHELANCFRSTPDGKPTEFHERLVELLGQEDKSLQRDFLRLNDHFKEAHDVLDRKSNDPNYSDNSNEIAVLSGYLGSVYSQAYDLGFKMVDKLIREMEGDEIHPEVLVLQGGGAKGMAYAGVIEHLSDKGILKHIQRVSGTSAGALMGLPLAMGYNSDEINDIVHNGRFAQFFAEATLKFKGLTAIQGLFGANSPSDKPYLEGHLLRDFAQNYFMPILEENTSIKCSKWKIMSEDELQYTLKILDKKGNLKILFDKSLSEFKRHLTLKGREHEFDVLKFQGMLNRSPQIQCALTCIRLSRSDRRLDADIVEAFIGDVIQLKLDEVPLEFLRKINPPISTLEEKRRITFSQLEQLKQVYPRGNFKEFGVAITDSLMPVTLNNLVRFCGLKYRQMVTYFNGDKPEDNGVGPFYKQNIFKPVFARAPAPGMDYVDMPIQRAVRASMNLPGVFSAIKQGGMRMIDGGLTNNFAQRMFADKYADSAESSSKTIGFMLSSLNSYIENKGIHKLIKGKDCPLDAVLNQSHQDLPGRLKGIALAMGSPLQSFQSWAGNFLAKRIEGLMSAYNTTMPNMSDMDNIGVINTGLVNTADFHLSRNRRIELHTAGKQASIHLSGDPDKHFRYTWGRLISLIEAEIKISDQMGALSPDVDRLRKFKDEDSLSVAMTGSKDKIPLSNVILRKHHCENQDDVCSLG